MRTAIQLTAPYKEQMENILSEICEIFEEDIENIQSRSRKHGYVKFRNLFFYVACNILSKKIPLRIIGDFIGGHHHSTVVTARDAVKGYISNKDPWFIDEWLEYQEKSTIWKNYLSAA